MNKGTFKRRRFGRKRPADAPFVASPPLADIYPTDAGDYAVGIDGPAFPTMQFATAVADREVQRAKAAA
jgi:hypothetical protein